MAGDKLSSNRQLMARLNEPSWPGWPAWLGFIEISALLFVPFFSLGLRPQNQLRDGMETGPARFPRIWLCCRVIAKLLSVPSSSSSCFLLLLEVRAFEADRFDRLNFSPIEVWREVPTLAIVVSCLTVSWHSAATNVYAQSLVFCRLCGAIGGGNDWIAGMADRILAHSGKGYQEFGL